MVCVPLPEDDQFMRTDAPTSKQSLPVASARVAEYEAVRGMFAQSYVPPFIVTFVVVLSTVHMNVFAATLLCGHWK